MHRVKLLPRSRSAAAGGGFRTGYLKNHLNNYDLVTTVNMYTRLNNVDAHHRQQSDIIESEHEVEEEQEPEGDLLNSEDDNATSDGYDLASSFINDDDDDDDSDTLANDSILGDDDDDTGINTKNIIEDDDDDTAVGGTRKTRKRKLSSSSSDSSCSSTISTRTNKKICVDDDAYINQIIDLYDSAFDQNSYGIYRGFAATDSKITAGIPYLIQHFSSADFKPFDGKIESYTLHNDRKANAIDFCHVIQYLTANEFNRSVLSNQATDPVMYAIVSFMVRWSHVTLDAFASAHPKFRVIAAELQAIKSNQVAMKHIQQYRNEPYATITFKVLIKHFNYADDHQQANNQYRVGAMVSVPRERYFWTDYINAEFIMHLRHVYKLLRTNTFDSTTIAGLLNCDMALPYTLQNFDVDALVAGRESDPKLNKYLTGEACCCKTSILKKLSKYGWKVYSRGDVGSFSGKATNPIDVGHLHAALHFVHQQPDVIGDRGFIDNVLWSFIMPQCSGEQDETMIKNLISFLTTFNEPTIAQYLTHKVVIFVDPYSERLRERQLSRCTGGDALRARIPMYPYAQFIAYYAIARLFKWKLITVPYSEDGSIDQHKYLENVDEILDYFGEPVTSSGNEFVRYPCPANMYTIDNTVPRSIGIFK